MSAATPRPPDPLNSPNNNDKYNKCLSTAVSHALEAKTGGRHCRVWGVCAGGECAREGVGGGGAEACAS